MSAYWVNFISTGDPNGNGLDEWFSVKEKPKETMELGDRMGSRPVTSSEKFEVLKKLFNSTEH
jgi:carboxylesterase type B